VQPFSLAGKKQAQNDERYLWPQFMRVISELNPKWIFGENVPGIINLALDDVCEQLENKNYETRAYVFPASAIGAIHQRYRVAIIAHIISESSRKWKVLDKAIQIKYSRFAGSKDCQDVTNSSSLKHAKINEEDNSIRKGWDAWRNARDGFSRCNRTKTIGKHISPEFAEWMMGYPAGWTDIATTNG